MQDSLIEPRNPMSVGVSIFGPERRTIAYNLAQRHSFPPKEYLVGHYSEKPHIKSAKLKMEIERLKSTIASPHSSSGLKLIAMAELRRTVRTFIARQRHKSRIRISQYQ